MKPISYRYLKSSINLFKKTGEDAYGQPTYATGEPIRKVGVESAKKNTLQDLGEQAADRLVVYHDVVRSTPATYEKGDKVGYGGEEYYVREAQLFPNPDDPHHWEVRLT